jgi:DNA-binding beta-propeller fold protein YncE
MIAFISFLFRCGRTLTALLFACGLLALFAIPAGAQTAKPFGVITLYHGINQPTGVALDSGGNVYVSDSSSGAVKRISVASGYTTVSTLSSGFNQPNGIAVDGSGNLYVADTGNNAVKQITAVSGYTTVNALGSGFIKPMGVALDAGGNVYVADSGNNAVKQISAASGYTKVITLSSGHSQLSGIAVDSSENVYVAESGNNAVKEILAAGGYTTVNTLGRGLNKPVGLALDASGNLYIADSGNNAVKQVSAAGGYTTVTTLSGGFNLPSGIALDANGNVYVADSSNNAIKEIVSGAVMLPTTAVGSTSTSLCIPFTFETGGQIGSPVLLTQGTAGLDFADARTGTCSTNGASNRYNAGDVCTVNINVTPKFPGQRMGAVELTTTAGAVIATSPVYAVGTGPEVSFPANAAVKTVSSDFNTPYGVALDGRGNIFIADFGKNAVNEILAVGGYTTINTLGSGFNYPTGVAVDGSGNVFIADQGNNAVKEVLESGGYTTINILGSGFSYPTGVTVDGSGNVFVADYGNNAVKEILAAGGYITVHTLGSGFNYPTGVAVDAAGNIYVADTGNTAVKQITAASGYTTVNTLGSGFNQPTGVAVDASGNVYVADKNNVAEILAVGGYTTVTALSSGFSNAMGIVLDGGGNVFVADYGNGAVKQINLSDPPALTFAITAVNATSTDSPMAVTFANIGNAALTFPTLANSNPSVAPEFSVDNSSSCPIVASSGSGGSLGAGESCTYAVDFTPTAAGTISGSLIVTDTQLNAAAPNFSKQSIALSGTGSAENPATLAVTSSANLSTYSAQVTFTAVVTPAINMGAPGGTVTFLDKGNAIGTGTVSGGVATFPTSTLVVGTHTITASYSGDANYGVSTASLASNPLIVKQAGTTTSVTSSVNAQAFGNSITFTATVSSNAPATGTPTGSVTFMDGGNPIGSGTLSGGVGTFTTSTLAAGSHTITTSYGGDANFFGDTGVLTGNPLVMNKANTTTTLFPSQNPSVYGQAVTLNATVAPMGTGTVTFYSGTVMLGSCELSAGWCTYATSNLPVGVMTLTAVYSGDGNYSTSTSASFKENEIKASSSIALQTSAPILVNNPVTLTVKVTSLVSGMPTGTVAFLDANNPLGTATLDNTGSACLTTSTLPVGFNSLTAVYSGDSNFYGANGAAVSMVQDFQLQLSQEVSVVQFGGIATYKVKVSPTNGTTFPGTISFGLTGLPVGATYTASPILAGSGAQTITVQVQTPAHLQASRMGSSLLALGLLLPFAGLIGLRKGMRGRATLGAALFVLLLMIGMLDMSGCAGNGEASYCLELTASSGNLQHFLILHLGIK